MQPSGVFGYAVGPVLIRRSTVALLLLAQGLGLLHLALESHTAGATGEQLDVSLLHDDAHHSQAPHVCAPEGDAALAPFGVECAVVAAFHAPAVISVSHFTSYAAPELPPARALVTFETPPQDVLARAPKSSPPAV